MCASGLFSHQTDSKETVMEIVYFLSQDIQRKTIVNESLQTKLYYFIAKML